MKILNNLFDRREGCKNLLLIIAVLISLLFHSQVNNAPLFVNVNLSQPIKNVKSMTGFLHYTDIYSLESDVKELKPRYWRIGAFGKSINDVDYLVKNNITPVIVISDLYGYPGKKNNKDWPHPLESKKLEDLIVSLYKKLGNSVIYDVWNEPYHQEASGDFDQKEFYQIFKKTHDLIRSQPGGKNAKITGPSFDHYDEREIEDFLKYCNDNNVVINILNWHEWRSGESLENLKKDIDNLRKIILPKYPKVKVEKIAFFEIINQYIQFSPTEILQVLKTLEDLKIDGACKGCWKESDGIVNCETNTLNGLLDRNGMPRSIWWGYKYYAQSIANRVNSSTNHKEFVSFASFDKTKVNLLLSNNSKDDFINTNININNIKSLSFLKNLKKVKIQIYEIPYTGEKNLRIPKLILSQSIKISSKLNFKIPLIKPKTVYYLLIQ